jgi:FAD binding domain
MSTRREFLKVGAKAGAALTLGNFSCTWRLPEPSPSSANDIHSQLNWTRVHRIVQPSSAEDITAAIQRARAEGRAVSIAGGRHAMGGQQFGTDTVLLDTRSLNRVLQFDPDKGEVEVEAGIQWPELVRYLIEAQKGRARQWGIIQKQTGAIGCASAGRFQRTFIAAAYT